MISKNETTQFLLITTYQKFINRMYSIVQLLKS